MFTTTALPLLLQTLLITLTSAAPLTTQSSDPLGGQLGGGIAGFIVLVLDIIVWIEVFRSNRDVLPKVGWALLVFIFPVVGIIIYFLFSNRQAHKPSGGYEVIP